MWQYRHTNELYHHGVIGMKWGVRRYQNKDGSLTPAGKKRLTKGIDDDSDSVSKKTKKSIRKKTIKDMSDEEIRERISRLELEKKYSDLADSVKKANTSRGKEFVLDVLDKSGKNIAIQTVTYAMGSAVNKFAKDAIKIKNGTQVLKDKDGKVLIDEKGLEKVAETFVDIVNPRKGQKDK